MPCTIVLIVLSLTIRPAEYRKLTLWAGLICIPGSALALLHNLWYWQPVRLGGGPFGVEDIMFTFSVGALSCLLAAFPHRRRLKPDIQPLPCLKRFLLSGVLFGAFCLFLWLAGIKGLENTLTGGAAALAVLLFHRRDLIPLATTGFLLFSPVYLFIVKIQFMLWPDYVSQWNAGGFLGKILAGCPWGEIIFAALFGAGWPVYIAYIFNFVLAKPGRQGRKT